MTEVLNYFNAELDPILSGQLLVLVEPQPAGPGVGLCPGLGALAGLRLAAGGGVLVAPLGLHQFPRDGKWRCNVGAAKVGIRS